MSCYQLSQAVSAMTGFKIHSDPKRNRVDSRLILGLVNELTEVHNLIVDDQMFIAGFQLGSLQKSLVLLMEQLENKERGAC